MSSSSTSPRESALVPTLFLIGITGLLVYFAVPQPYRDGPLPTAAPTQAPTAVVAAAAVEPTPEDHLTLMAFGLEEVPASGVQAGSRLYSTTCTACHGSDAKGILGLGKTLVDSPFVNKLNDDDLVAFLNVGRPASDPENTTKVGMPAKGGNPSLTDDDMHAIVDYIRSLNGATVVQDSTEDATPIPTARPFEAINVNSIPSAPSTSPTQSAPVESASATPQAPVIEATPVTSYGYDTQAQVSPTAAPAEPTAAPAEPTAALAVIDPLMNVIPTSVYSYSTGPEATNEPVIYEYDMQE